MNQSQQNMKVEFEDRATPYSFRLHVKKELEVNGNKVHISISPHFGRPALFGVEEQVTKPNGDCTGDYVLFTQDYDEVVSFLRETYNIEPVFPEDFLVKAHMVATEIIAEQKKRIARRGKKQ